ncbi:amidohydrolase family protein [Paenibacillus sp. Marseille-Q4541]|uniref:amidohydrolase family protein n=1 Tax=Paenibacillus sp. Marseille-Q4541 TaxID=2831522 RepID=UPI001BA89369|nr:amidohydrolase family protein [Paenibacillus sp. Marseille-Q4541]
MKIIALEEHFTNPALNADIQKQVQKLSPHFYEAFGNNGLVGSPNPEELMDLGDIRIANMDANKIDIQCLSYSAPGAQILPPAEAISFAREANDYLADSIKAHPDRFVGFAMLPTSAPEQAAIELERAVQQLNFKGFMINGRTDDLFLDHVKFRPILEAASALDVPLFLHPSLISKGIQESYYGGFDPVLSTRFATAGFGWHAETGIHAMRMILGGIFDEYPNLQIILGHWGEMIPPFLERLDLTMSGAAKHLQRSVSEYFTNHMYVTPSGMWSLPQLKMNMDIMGADRIMYSVDYPFIKNEEARAFLENAPISDLDKEKIAYSNAKQLLKL